LSRLYTHRGNAEKARHFTTLGLTIAYAEEDQAMLANAYLRFTEFLRIIDGKYSEAQDNANKALELMQLVDDKKGISAASNQLGILYEQDGNFEAALKCYHRSLEISQSINDETSTAALLTNIGTFYHTTNNHDKAIKHLLQALEINRKLNSTNLLSINLNNIGAICIDAGQYEEALPFLKEALELSKKDQNKGVMARNIILIGEVFSNKGDYEEALEHMLIGLQLAEEIGETGYKGEILDSIAGVYINMERYDDALEHLDNAIELARNLGIKSRLLYAYEKKAIIYDKKGDFETSLRYYQKFVVLKNEFLNEESTRRIAEIEAKNKWEKKQRENEIYRLKNVELKKALENLRSTQAQLIHAEKMSSLGNLAAGIAHEIKNPLNFINNFAELSTELVDEIFEDVLREESMSAEEKLTEVEELLADFKGNSEKIRDHGIRANSIVQNMMLHARSERGEKQPVDLNHLIEENVNLAYHGYKANHKDFTVDLEITMDDKVGMIKVVPQDFGRVIINLVNNAFDAMEGRGSNETKTQNERPKPKIKIETKRSNQGVEIKIRDNGPGIPKDVLDKIFNPFFTTKPAGIGTGLGLSLSYEIISKGHGGELKVNTEKGKFTEFFITIPNSDEN
jgi:signal transduction histidine kinase/lipopolysaccharide biosynthesis regulator YciM